MKAFEKCVCDHSLANPDAMCATLNLFVPRTCALWTKPDSKRLKLLKKNAKIFLSPLDFELTQKLSLKMFGVVFITLV